MKHAPANGLEPNLRESSALQGVRSIGYPESREFTYRYAQPDAYHFCLDSIILPHAIAQEFPSESIIGDDFRVLDVCSGCGVIGFELAYHLPAIHNLDFLEIQEEFRPYFEENLEITGSKAKNFRFLPLNYERLLTSEFEATYDLIVGNPPYFHPGEGKLTPLALKNRCRFFLDSTLPTLGRAVVHALKPDGRAYLLVKSGAKHGRNHVRELQGQLAEVARVVPFADIRGTLVVQITKLTERRTDLASSTRLEL